MRLRAAWRLTISAIVFVLSAELLALVWYYGQTGHVFYSHPRTDEAVPSPPEEKGRLLVAVHPYFGFAHRPGVSFYDERLVLLGREDWPPPPQDRESLSTNNFGFISPHAYPLDKTRENQFFVGIFGGSVGMWFCQVGAPRLVESLRQHPFFRTREIVPLCFSYSGYKQPQLALVLAYFLSIGQPFDLVVNIDGFNDVALSALNDARGLDSSMPSVQHVDGLVNLVNQSTLTPEKVESLAAIFRDRARLIDVRDTMRSNRMAAIDVVLNAYYTRVRGRYTEELSRFDALPSNPPQSALVQLTPSVATRDRAALFTDIAAIWTRSSMLMRDLLATRGAAYVHFLQPNQYYTKRQFSRAEAATALSDKSPYRRSVEQGYPVLQTAARSALAESGVSFFDATRVLDREPAPVYLDECCHYTVAGNRVLADFIAASILDTPGPWRR
jgi:hypothetical protein